MSSATLPDEAPIDPDDELLVAYLDGELDAKSESDLMNRLLDDEELNRRLRQLQEGWEWLDKLPNATPNEKLVESTLELVVADIVKAAPQSESSWWQRYRVPLMVVGACLLAIAASFAVVETVRAMQYRQQLRDLAIAENLNAYLHGSDRDLMRQLNANNEWEQMIAAARQVGEFGVVDKLNIAATPVSERDDLLAELPLEDRPQLASRWATFVRLDEATDRQVRQTAAAVEVAPDSDTLLRTMEAYALWREKLPDGLVDRIESDNAKDRRNAISEAINLTLESIRKRSRDQLDDETVERIYFVLRQILKQRIENDPGFKDQVDQMQEFFRVDDPEPYAIFNIVWGGGGSQRGGRRSRPPIQVGPGPRSPGGGGPRPPWGRTPPLREDELAMIRLVLPSDAIDMLEVVTATVNLEDTMILRNLTLRSWAEEAVRRKRPRGDRQTLLERYEDMPTEQRDRVDLMPPEKMLEHISRPPWSFGR